MSPEILPLLVALLQGAVFPWKSGAKPPAVAGVHLGDTRARLDSLLGAPDSTQNLGPGAYAFTYARRGLSIVYTLQDGAAIVYLVRRTAGDIGTVRVGDTKQQVLARWGPPSSAQPPNALYQAGSWVVVVVMDTAGHSVARLGLGRVAGRE